MGDETSFLRALLAAPGDVVLRGAYADWLDERRDGRAEYVRLDSGLERINCVDWLEQDGNLDYYVQMNPVIARLAAERQAAEPQRQRLRGLGAGFDPQWVAFIESLGQPFRPFSFFNNHGNPDEFRPGKLPFADQLGTRGSVVVFESDFRTGDSFDEGLRQDLHFLRRLQPRQCYYGAATCPVHPFVCEIHSENDPPTGRDILRAVRPQSFRGGHIETLDVSDLPHSGNHFDTSDEIHTDPTEQHIFVRPGEDDESGDGPDDTHDRLREYVADGRLWYVLLHGAPDEEGRRQAMESFRSQGIDVSDVPAMSRYVLLFAVGRSPHGGRLVGVVSHQVCHNLCD